MIDGVEILLDIQPIMILGVLIEPVCPPQGFMQAFAFSAGIAVHNHGFFQDRANDIADGMMHHSICKRGAGNNPFFWLIDSKMPVCTKSKTLIFQIALDSEQLFFPVIVKAIQICAVLALSGILVCT
jgi:hypothetical protein